jgi:hypothetical protein
VTNGRRLFVTSCLLLASALIHREASAFRLPSSGCPDGGIVPSPESSDNDLSIVQFVKEPSIMLHGIVSDAEADLKRCPRDESAWYELVRGEEMLSDYSFGTKGRSKESLARLTAEAVRQIPDSPRIALIDARARPEPRHVADLVVRFPKFAPLQVALANAQLNSGDVDVAAETMRNLKDIASVPGGIETLAAIQLTKGDASAALKTLASKEHWVVDPAGAESELRIGRIFRQHSEIAYQAHLALHHPAAAVQPLLHAAEYGSTAAKELLKNPPPELAKAIAAARRAGKLNAKEREYLKDLRKQ